jgi:hypothetical protein
MGEVGSLCDLKWKRMKEALGYKVHRELISGECGLEDSHGPSGQELSKDMN